MRVFVALGSVLLIAAAVLLVTADDASWVGRVRSRAAGLSWPRFLLSLFTGELIYVAVYGTEPPSTDPAACAGDDEDEPPTAGAEGDAAGGAEAAGGRDAGEGAAEAAAAAAAGTEGAGTRRRGVAGSDVAAVA